MSALPPEADIGRLGGRLSICLHRAASRSDPNAMANLVEKEIAQPFAAVAQGSQQPMIHEISQQDRIARFYAIMYGIGRMPSVVTDRKCIARVGCKSHLCFLRHRTVGQLLMENGADVGAGVVLREIDLGCNAFPMRVSVRRDP